jgi:hypothetical protein
MRNTSFGSNRRARNRADKSVAAIAPPTVVTLSVSANKLVCTFDMPVVARGLPQIGLSGGAHVGTEYPISKVVNSLNQVTFTYANNVAVANTGSIPERDPMIRTHAGGFMQAKTFTL